MMTHDVVTARLFVDLLAVPLQRLDMLSQRINARTLGVGGLDVVLTLEERAQLRGLLADFALAFGKETGVACGRSLADRLGASSLGLSLFESAADAAGGDAP